MAQGRIPDVSVRIAEFAKAELDLLVEELSTEFPSLRVTDISVMSAIVLAARRSPTEAVAAVLGTYWEREREVAAVEAVGAFLRAMAK